MTTGTFTAVGQASDSFQLTTGAGVQLVPDGAASAALQVSIDSGATWSTDAHLGGTEPLHALIDPTGVGFLARLVCTDLEAGTTCAYRIELGV